MKKEILELVEGKEGRLKINQFCSLCRWTQDAIGNEVDRLEVNFSICHHFCYTVEIKSRDWHGIVSEIVAAQTKAFEQSAEKLNKELLNGYIS